MTRVLASLCVLFHCACGHFHLCLYLLVYIVRVLRLHVLLYSLKNVPRIHYQQYVLHPCGTSRPVRHRFFNNVDMYVYKV